MTFSVCEGNDFCASNTGHLIIFLLLQLAGLMSGLRRVVGVTMQPLQTGAGIPVNTNSPHPLYQHRVMQGHGSPCLSQYRLPLSPLLLCSPLHSPAPLPHGGRYQPPHSLSLHPMGASGVTSPGKRKSDVLARDGGSVRVPF